MNEQLLQSISTDVAIIKWLFIGFVILVVLMMVGIGCFIIMASKDLSRTVGPKPNFREKGGKLLDKGEIEELLELSKEKLEEYPEHVYANYFIANCYYRMGNIHEAYRVYNKLKMLKPGWSEEFIDPYLKELEIKIKNSKPEIIK